MYIIKKEQEFFESLRRETKIEILIREGAYYLCDIRDEIDRKRQSDEVPMSEDDSLSRHFGKCCGKVKNLAAKMWELTEEAIRIGPNQLPVMLFAKFGPAFEWIIKELSRYFADDEEGLNVTLDFRDAFRAYKGEFRSESQTDDNPDAKRFADTLRTAMKNLEAKGKIVARRIEVIEERKALAKDASYQKLANGKGCSSFGQIGQLYKGIMVVDPTHISLYGTVLEITSRACWNLLDEWLEAHFSDVMFEVRRRQLEKFSSSDGIKLRRFIYLQTREEVGQPRRGNAIYTGFGEFRQPR